MRGWFPGGKNAACKAAVELCQSCGADASFLGVLFCPSEPRIPSTVTGAASAVEMRTNLRTLTEPIVADLLRDVEAVLAPLRIATWPNGHRTDREPTAARRAQRTGGGC